MLQEQREEKVFTKSTRARPATSKLLVLFLASLVVTMGKQALFDGRTCEVGNRRVKPEFRCGFRIVLNRTCEPEPAESHLRLLMRQDTALRQQTCTERTRDGAFGDRDHIYPGSFGGLSPRAEESAQGH